MRISDIIETAGVGRVVPGVNMPKGIHPNEITRQAAKFGNRVDRDGRPPITSTNGRDALREKSQTTNAKPTGLKLSEAPVPGTKFVSLDRVQLEEALAYLKELGEHINGDSIKYEDHPAISAKLNRDYKAITAVTYVMQNNLKALKDPKLAEKSIFLYDVDDSDLSYMDFVGGIHVVVEDGVAEATWIGSYDADGSGLLRAAMKIAKARGARRMTLDAKWESEGFYTKMGFQQAGPTVHRPFSGTSLTPFKKELEERWSKKYKKSINCSNPKGFSQRAHCAGRKARKHGEKTKSQAVHEHRMDDLVETMLHALREKGLDESHAVTIIYDRLDENLRKWFRQKWVRFGPDGKIRGACARGKESEGKPKCLPQSKAHSLGKEGRAKAARRKRREDPNPDRRGKAKNVATKQENVAEGVQTKYLAARYIDEFADGEHWYVKGAPDVIEKFVRLANSLEDEATKGTEYEPGKGMMAKMHAGFGNDAIPQWTIVPAQNLEGIRPIGNTVLQKLVNPDLSRGAQEFMSDLLWRLEEKNLALLQEEGDIEEDSNIPFDQCPQCGGDIVHESKLNEKKDACYHKVKSRYKVWPSAYASGALVQCRKKGAKNWGKKS